MSHSYTVPAGSEENVEKSISQNTSHTINIEGKNIVTCVDYKVAEICNVVTLRYFLIKRDCCIWVSISSKTWKVKRSLTYTAFFYFKSVNNLFKNGHLLKCCYWVIFLYDDVIELNVWLIVYTVLYFFCVFIRCYFDKVCVTELSEWINWMTNQKKRFEILDYFNHETYTISNICCNNYILK